MKEFKDIQVSLSIGKEPSDGRLSRWVRELKRTSFQMSSYLH